MQINFDEIGNFIFGTYEGIGLSILAFLILCIVGAVISERMTRRKYVDRHTKEDEDEFFAEDYDD